MRQRICNSILKKLAQMVNPIIAYIYNHTPAWPVNASTEPILNAALARLENVSGLSLMSYILMTITIGGMVHMLASIEAYRLRAQRN